MTDDKDIFEKIENLKLDENQMNSLYKFSYNQDEYNRMFVEINEFITSIEPDIDKKKLQAKTEALLRSYPSTLISDLNKTEKWFLFNNLAHLYLTMAIDSIKKL